MFPGRFDTPWMPACEQSFLMNRGFRLPKMGRGSPEAAFPLFPNRMPLCDRLPGMLPTERGYTPKPRPLRTFLPRVALSDSITAMREEINKVRESREEKYSKYQNW